ncbi:MAG: hypothetical protein O9342_03315 [Beijerinckiaceae bacterium]|nr:hypothetical protein [Beijerinckiaceae bacterium]
MQAKNPNWLSRILRIEPGISLGQWFWDRLSSLWPLIVAAVGGGGMTISAAFTTWLDKWGYFGLTAVGVISALVILLAVSVVRILASIARENNAKSRYLEASGSLSKAANPMLDVFRDQIIDINDLFIPYQMVLSRKNFRNCHIKGPGVIFTVSHVSFTGPHFKQCNFIVVNSEKDFALRGVVAFEHSQFDQCQFIDITFVIDQTLAKELSASMPHAKFLGFEFDGHA